MTGRQMVKSTMTIGEVASAAGVNRQTLRYYERRGILRPPDRTDSGYRLYPPDAARIVLFIKKAQKLGFSLDEIEGLLALRENSSRTCGEVRTLAEEKLTDIDEKIRRLRAMRRTLGKLVKNCGKDGNAPDCPILEALDRSPR